MPSLQARGSDSNNHWRRPFPAGPVTLGRNAAKSDWSVPWDPLISKLHATLTWRDNRLSVRKAPDAVNPIYYKGVPLDAFILGVGEPFVIGETTFVVQESELTSGNDLP